jgi:hypothetical protein
MLSEDIVVRQYPDDCGPYTIRTYYGPGNFTEYSDGLGNTNYNGFQRAEEIVGKANEELANNGDQWRKEPGVYYPPDTPDNKIRYILVGTYFHRDNWAFNNVYDNTLDDIHAIYDVGGNSVIDIYCVFASTVPWSGNAYVIGSGNKFVFVNDYLVYLRPNCREWSKQFAASNLNHEIGHTLNLSHTWNANDGCLDTPLGFIYDQWRFNQNTNMWECLLNQYANCWNYNPGIPTCPQSTGGKPCDDWGKVSNNIMDYNEYFLHAYTQCQIDRIHANLNGNGNSYIHSCNGCMPSKAFFFVHDSVRLCSPFGLNVWLNEQGSFNEDRYLLEICEVTASQPDDCVLGSYYNSSWQTGTIGKVNMSTFYSFQADKLYKVKLTVDNTECPGSTTHEKLLQTLACTPSPPPCCPVFGLTAVNPFGENLTVYYDAAESGPLSLSLVHLTTGQTTVLRSESEIAAGAQQEDFATGSVAPGNYALRAIFKGVQYSKTVVKL